MYEIKEIEIFTYLCLDELKVAYIFLVCNS